MSGMFANKLYDVITLYDCMQDPASMAWLISMDVPLPGAIPPGAYPTPEEIKRTLDSITGIHVDYLEGQSCWQAAAIHREDVSWAILAVQDYSGNPAEPHHFGFVAGWDEMILLITSHLVRVCGPLVLLPPSGAAPQIVM
jgi:hypothetical protein